MSAVLAVLSVIALAALVLGTIYVLFAPPPRR